MPASEYFSGYLSRYSRGASATSTASSTAAESSTEETKKNPTTTILPTSTSNTATQPTMINRILNKVSSRTHSAGDESNSSPANGDAAVEQSDASAVPLQECRDPESANDAPAAADTQSSQTTATTTTTASNAASNTAQQPLPTPNPLLHPRALKILFLSSDTGGGHRASAQSLAQQFQRLFPGSTHDLCDIVQLDGPPPYNTLVSMYKHLSAHPHQWKLVYNVSNTRAYEMLADVHMKSLMERSVRRRIMAYDPDVVVSVHPLMTNVPVLACANIAKETGRHVPIFTVCTDLGSAHSMWFANGVEKLFVASEMIRDLAMQRGKVPLEKIVMSGLPIRRDFSVQAELMRERHSEGGRVYQRFVRESVLNLKGYGDRKTVLVMGGGEGCGRLSNIVDSLYLQFVERGMDALILVVCGRNDKLKESLKTRNWDEMKMRYLMARHKGADYDTCVGILSDAGCIDGGLGVANHLRRIISSPSLGMGVGMAPSNPFSPSSAAVNNNMYVANHEGFAMSLPTSRSGSPGPTLSSEDESIEVVSESFVKRNYAADVADSDGEAASLDDDAKNNDNTSNNNNNNNNNSNEMVPSTTENGIIQQEDEEPTSHDQVKVIGLGFITKMAEYMVAADVLVSKAGPGTIAEAAALSLPVMLTSFLPGQEEGNVDFVVEGGFGNYVSDSDPNGIAEEVTSWLLDNDKLKGLSDNAHKRGSPDAAAEIVDAIGKSALRWKKSNEGLKAMEGEGFRNLEEEEDAIAEDGTIGGTLGENKNVVGQDGEAVSSTSHE